MKNEYTPEMAIEIAKSSRDLHEMRLVVQSLVAQLKSLQCEQTETVIWKFALLVKIGRLTAERGVAVKLAAARLEQMVLDRKQVLIQRDQAIAAESIGIAA